ALLRALSVSAAVLVACGHPPARTANRARPVVELRPGAEVFPCGPLMTGVIVRAPSLDLHCEHSTCSAVVPVTIANCTDRPAVLRRLVVRRDEAGAMQVDAGDAPHLARIEPGGTFVHPMHLGAEGRYVVVVEGAEGTLGSGSFTLTKEPNPV